MWTIWKYAKELDQLGEVIEFEMPSGAEILSAINQNECLTIYANVNRGRPMRRRQFCIAGTGHPINYMSKSQFVGTASFREGRLIFHVFDLGFVN